MASKQMGMTGGRELAQVLEQLPRQLQEPTLAKGLRPGATEIRDEARDWAPEATGGPSHPEYGRLSANIRVNKATKSQRRFKAHLIIHTGDAFWGMFKEFGTSKESAQPWFRPAVEAAWASALRAIGKRLARLVTTEADKLAGKYGSLGKTRRRRLGR